MNPSINMILTGNYNPSIPWSQRKLNGQRSSLINDIRRILNLLSGYELTIMIRDLIKPNEVASIAVNYYNALKNLSKPINNIKKKNQHFFYRPLKLAGLTKIDLENMGYKIGKSLWSSCKQNHERKLGGRPKINQSTIDCIHETVEKYSAPSSFRIIQVKKRKSIAHLSQLEPRKKMIKLKEKRETEVESLTVLNRTETINELKKKFDQSSLINHDKDVILPISHQTFINYVKSEKVFKKPKNRTDLCLHCEKGILLKKEIDQIKENASQNINFTTKIKELEAIEYHYSIAQRQKCTYNRYRTEPEFLGEDSILIDVDYKQKIYYGKNNPRQKTAEFYSYASCSLLGFGIYYVDKRLNKVTNIHEKFINCWNIDILCASTSQKAADYIDGFRFLRSLPMFKSIEKKYYIIFSDTAKVFRCKEVNHFYLIELAKLDISVSFNYFAEYHGKSIRDQHFSIISMYLKNKEYSKRLMSVNDVCNCLNLSQDESNKNRFQKGLIPINYIAIIKPIKDKIETHELKISQLESLYNIQNIKINGDFKTHSTIFSDLNNLITIEITEGNKVNTNCDKLTRAFLDDPEAQSSGLILKHTNIKNDLARAIRIREKQNQLEFNEDVEPDLTQNSFIPSDEQIPKFCKTKHSLKMHDGACEKHCYFSLAELKDFKVSLSTRLQEELFNHGHPKSLLKTKTKYYNTLERRKELIEHYEVYHQKK